MADHHMKIHRPEDARRHFFKTAGPATCAEIAHAKRWRRKPEKKVILKHSRNTFYLAWPHLKEADA